MVRRLTSGLWQRVVPFAARLFPHRFFAASVEEYDPNELIAGISEDNLHDAVIFGRGVGSERLDS